MKHFLKIMVVLVLVMSLATFGCKKDGGGTTLPTNQSVTSDSDSTSTAPEDSGVSNVEGIIVQNGNILVDLSNGQITINGQNLTLTEQVDGTWSLIAGVQITVTDNNGNTISGSIYVDPQTGNLFFIPDSPLDSGVTYTVTVTVNGTTYNATVIVSVDNLCQSNSLFASVELRSTGTYNVKDLIVSEKAIFGWEFGNTFTITLSNVEAGAQVTLTAYGVYDIEGHNCEVYFQRWSGTGAPVQDYVWNNGGAITVDNSDSSIDGEGGTPDYSFKKTYFKLKVMKDGQDITATTNAVLTVN